MKAPLAKVTRAVRGGREIALTGAAVCCECGQAFELSLDHAAWFEQRGMKPPRRCERCRAARRALAR